MTNLESSPGRQVRKLHLCTNLTTSYGNVFDRVLVTYMAIF